MRIFGREVTFVKKPRTPKNKAGKVIETSSYASADFWDDISNAYSTNREMKIAAVFRCIDVLSDNISMLPWAMVNTKTKLESDDQYSQQVWYLLNRRPNRNMTPADFFKTLEIHRLRGNAYAEIVSDSKGLPQSLEILSPENVQLKKLADKSVVYDITEEGGAVRRLPSSRILHFKNNSEDGLVGYGVLHYAGDTVSTMLAQERFNKDFYSSGGVLGGILEVASDLAGKTMNVPKGNPNYGKLIKAVMSEEFVDNLRMSPGAIKVAVIDNGTKYHEIKPISQKDMAFIESKESNIADIARLYGVPLFMLFSGKESYESNEANSIMFVASKLNPIVTTLEQEMSYKLLTNEQLRSGLQIKANLRVLLRGDTAARASYYEKLRNIGAMSVNDVRKLEDMSSVEGGDSYLASLNYVPLKDFEQLSKARNEVNNEGGESK